MRIRLQLLVIMIALGGGAVVTSAGAPRFYDDDPIAKVPERSSAVGAKPLGIGLFFEYSYNLLVNERRQPSNRRAGNINTIDEVPDSSWFTNRIGTDPITPERLDAGPNSDGPPSPETWTLLRQKSAGTNAGFTAKDASGRTWFVQFDAPGFPEASSGAVEVATKLFWALGYNEAQTFITTFDPARATIDPSATITRPSGAKTPFTRDDLSSVLEASTPNADGTFRVSASALIPGTILGPFRYSGTRSDDPNDLVPHEDRRELRALRVFGAWLNLVDWKAGNTLDSLVEEDGRSIVKHYLQDVGSSLGVANEAHEWDMGWEHFYETGPTLRRLYSFGFAMSPWQTVPYQSYSSIGLFEGDRFDPRTWRPQTPTEPYIEMRADDAFWAAVRVMAFSDDLIRAAVHVGRYSDPAAENHLADVLIKRRDTIGRVYLTAINPIVNPRLDASGLSFENVAVRDGFAEPPSAYTTTWRRFDNATGSTSPVGVSRTTGTSVTLPGDLSAAATGTYVEIDIAAESSDHPTWAQPIKTYFRRTADGWKLVGLERQPDSGPPSAGQARP